MDQNMQAETGLGYGFVGIPPCPAAEVGGWINASAPGLRGHSVGALSSNPKDAIGRGKTPLHLIPPAAMIAEARVMGLGAAKYGAFNWRDATVAATVYLSAAERHLLAFRDREDNDAESGESHLAHARACLAILVDAFSSGNVVDDRPKAGVAGAMMRESPAKPPCETMAMLRAQANSLPRKPATDAQAPEPPKPFLWYLATPYAACPDGLDVANARAEDALAALLRRGIKAFCPITHGHGAGKLGLPRTHEFWMDVDRPFMDRCDGIVLLRQPGWSRSEGMAYEAARFTRQGKPVVWTDDPCNPLYCTNPHRGFDELAAELARIARGQA